MQQTPTRPPTTTSSGLRTPPARTTPSNPPTPASATPRRRSAIHRMRRDLESFIETTAAAAAAPATPLSDRSNLTTPTMAKSESAVATTTPLSCALPEDPERMPPCEEAAASALLPAVDAIPAASLLPPVPKAEAQTPHKEVPEKEEPQKEVLHGPPPPAHDDEASALIALTAGRVRATLQLATTQLSLSNVSSAISSAPAGSRLAFVETQLRALVGELDDLARGGVGRSTMVPPPPSPAATAANAAIAATSTGDARTPPPVGRPAAQQAPSPPTPSYGETGFAASRLQSRWRGRAARRHAVACLSAQHGGAHGGLGASGESAEGADRARLAPSAASSVSSSLAASFSGAISGAFSGQSFFASDGFGAKRPSLGRSLFEVRVFEPNRRRLLLLAPLLPRAAWKAPFPVPVPAAPVPLPLLCRPLLCSRPRPRSLPPALSRRRPPLSPLPEARRSARHAHRFGSAARRRTASSRASARTPRSCTRSSPTSSCPYSPCNRPARPTTPSPTSTGRSSAVPSAVARPMATAVSS